MKRARFDKGGLLTMRADAWGLLFGVPESSAEPFELRGKSAIVTIEGPLTHHADWWCDSYDAIEDRVAAALASEAETVVLSIDSPGGEAAGNFELSAKLRAMAKAAGKPLVAYGEGMVASAAYALACAADTIAVSPSCWVGSVGVILAMVDVSRMNAAMGVNVALVASGKKKVYGHPDMPLSEAALEERQGQVDTLARLFFELVGGARGMSTDEVAGLEAGMLIGADAVGARLADRVCSFDALLEDLSSGNTKAPRAAEETMGWKDQMKQAAEEGDEEAKAALAALEEEEKKEAKSEEDDKPPPSEKKEEEKKEAKSEEDDDKKKDEESKASTSTKALVKEVARQDVELQALKAEAEQRKRAEMMSTRTDIKHPTILKYLASVPVSELQKELDGIEKPKFAHPAAAAGVTGTRGRREGDGASGGLDPTLSEKIDQRMGVSTKDDRVRWDGANRILPSNMSRDAAKEILQKNAARAASGGVK